MKYSNTVSQDRFLYPDMGDYYDEELMEEFLKSIDAADPVGPAYYIEEPFRLNTGYDEQYNAFVLKADPVLSCTDSKENGETGKEFEDLNRVDGDTVSFYLETVNDGSNGFEIDGTYYKSFSDYAYNKCNFKSFKQKVFELRFIGIDAPEIPHYCVTQLTNSREKNDIITVTTEEIKNGLDSKYVYVKNKKREKKEYKFLIKRNDHGDIDKYYEIIDDFTPQKEYMWKNCKDMDKTDITGNGKYYVVLNKDDTKPSDMINDIDMGRYAADLCIKTINESTDLRIVLDAKSLSTTSNYSSEYKLTMNGWQYDQSFWEYLSALRKECLGKSMDNDIYNGYSYFGQDAYKRFLGCIYVQNPNIAGGKWINLNKYIKYEVGDPCALVKGITPDSVANGNYLSDAFKLYSYDISKQEIADGFYDISKPDLDDRREIQKEITGLDFDQYKDFTVMIGDCLFMVPPTSIRVIDQIQSQRVPLLRSKGSMIKESPHNNRVIELDLFFNGDYGINGVPIKRQLPIQKNTNEHETYYMNGLRSLISMFKFTPFLPIENTYINDILNIEAVAFADLQIQTMPSYPKCLNVKLTLQDFNYRIYLNDIPVPDTNNGEDYTTNMFSRTIHYGVMRYYYQRALQQGELWKNCDITSQDFIENTMGNKTKLIPMEFKDQTIKFQILDENWLAKMKQLKMLAQKQVVQQNYSINEDTKKWATKIGNDLYTIKKAMDEIDLIKIKGNDMNKNIEEYYNKLKEKVNGKLTNIILSRYTREDAQQKGKITLSIEYNGLTASERKNLIKQIYDYALEDSTKYDTFYFVDKDPEIILEFGEAHTVEQAMIKKVSYQDEEANKVVECLIMRSSDYLDDTGSELDTDGWDNYNSSKDTEEFFENIKDNGIDTETILSAKFKEYPLEIVTQEFSIGMSNALSNTTLKSQEGYAPQYAGGQDTVLNFNFYTRDENTLTLLGALQKITAKQLIDYNSVIRCCPVRINSELTRLCGIYEILLETVDITTVPEQPGLFLIQCKALSIDRTMRNREALQRLDEINNAGATNPKSSAIYNYKTYFDLNSSLSKAEIYPDLELPSLDELDRTGYKFIRYSNKKIIRNYPDPDFYFVYGYVYSAQALRKSIVDFFKENTEKDTANDITNENGGENNSNTQGSFFNQVKETFFQSDNGTSVDVSLNDNKEEVLSYDYNDKEKYDKWKKDYYSNDTLIKDPLVNLFDGEPLDDEGNKYVDLFSSIYDSTWNVCTKIDCALNTDITKEKYVKEEMDRKKTQIISAVEAEISLKPLNAGNYEKNAAIYSNFSGMKVTEKELGDETYDTLNKSLNKRIDDKFDYDGILYRIFNGIFFDDGRDATVTVKKGIKSMILAAAIALSGKEEYSRDLDDQDTKYNYCPRSLILIGDTQLKTKINTSYTGMDRVSTNLLENGAAVPFSVIQEYGKESYISSSLDEALKKGKTFGIFQIKKYSKEFLQDFYSTDFRYKNVVFTEDGFLDPYYNRDIGKIAYREKERADDWEIEQYKEYLISSIDFSIDAFVRIILIWMRKLVQEEILITPYDTDIRIKDADLVEKVIKEIENDSSTKDSNLDDKKAVKEVLKEYDEALRQYDENIGNGKAFLPILCAVIDGADPTYFNIKKANVGVLKERTQACQSNTPQESEKNDDKLFRRLVKALCDKDNGLCDNQSDIGGTGKSSYHKIQCDGSMRFWVDKCDDPAAWIMHSFYDMVVNDKRGRMARAFPTYYMLIIDEGRKIGYWKLHDNFYNMSSIAEIEVIKSRKIPADTAKIVMTNLFKTYTTDDSDVKTNYSYNLRDVYNSIFSPAKYYEEAEETRLNQLNINQIQIRPGARIHLRMGYGGDAGSLPIVFNGVVAEIGSGELMEIIAQGDGHEISNTQAFADTAADDASELKNEANLIRWVYNFLNSGDSPRNLIKSIFTTKGGIIKNIIRKKTDGRFFNDNMFGITHFGDLDWKQLNYDGEIMQNIYEGEGGLPWQKKGSKTSLSAKCFDSNPPSFTVKLKDKSVWDVLNVCASGSIGFIVGIAPFGLRSTIFHGRPHYYYAYDYEINDSGVIKEKRKPFQQYHLIDSYSDIIGDNIKASATDVKTVVVPNYTGPSWFDTEQNKVLEPLYADIDIYPEYQKTMILDTCMQWKGKKVGALVINRLKDAWSNDGGYKIAWRMGANALMDSFKDMYKGEVIIIGDPTIKPFDRVELCDIYENIKGPMEVEAVVHRLSPDTGFTTSVYADCISTADDRFIQCSRVFTPQILMHILMFKSLAWGVGLAFKTSTKPMMSIVSNVVTKVIPKGANIISSVASFLGKDDLFNNIKGKEWEAKALELLGYGKAGVTKEMADAVHLLEGLGKWNDNLLLLGKKEITKVDDVVKNLSNMLRATEGKNPNSVIKALEAALKDSGMKKENAEIIKNTISNIKNIKFDSTALKDSIEMMSSKAITQLEALDELDDVAKESLKALKACKAEFTEASAKEALNALSKINIDFEKDELKKLAARAFTYTDEAAEAMAELTATAATTEAIDATTDITMKAAIKTGLSATNIIVQVVLIIMQFVVEKSIYNWVENVLGSMNVLTVYPLVKNGVPYVAGIDGHRGLVVGSPTWESAGMIDSFCQWAFGKGGSHQGLRFLLNTFLISDTAKQITEYYKKENRLGSYFNDETYTMYNLLDTMSNDEISYSDTYQAFLKSKRIVEINSEDSKYTYSLSRVKCDQDEIPGNNIIREELVLITSDNAEVEALMSDNDALVFNTIYNKGEDVGKTKIAYEINGIKGINGFISYKKNNNLIYLPFLRPDSFELLKLIFTKLKLMLSGKRYGEQTKKTLWLREALIVNSNTFYSTGYEFKLQIDIDNSIMENALKEIKEDINKQISSSGYHSVNIFDYRNKDDAWEILVYPRNMKNTIANNEEENK